MQEISIALLRAFESLCYEFIWIPMEDNGDYSQAFLRRKAGIANDLRRSAPGARGYIRIIKSDFFATFLEKKRVSGHDTKFITVCLASEVENLNKYRDDASHAPRNAMPRNAIDDCYRTFLGIGKRGVLPEFARIGRKLRVGRRGGR